MMRCPSGCASALPSTAAAAPELGRQLYEDLIARAHALHPEVASGRFGADMQVELINDGPVTLWLQVPPPPAA